MVQQKGPPLLALFCFASCVRYFSLGVVSVGKGEESVERTTPREEWPVVVMLTRGKLFRLFDLNGSLLDAPFDKFGFDLGFLSSEQINVGFECAVTRERDSDVVLSGTDQ